MNKQNCRIAALQMISGPRVADNLETAGRLVADFLVPEPPIPPVTTIAWRLDHVAREVLGKRARALFGGSPAGDADDIEISAELVRSAAPSPGWPAHCSPT